MSNTNDKIEISKGRSTILVTGGAGYIGSITTKQLIDAGFDVVVVDNMEKGHREAIDTRASFELADVGDTEQMGPILKKYNPAVVVDFAAYIAVGESMEEPEKYFQNNVANLINLLDQMVENKAGMLIKSSTAAVYGIPKDKKDLPLVESYTDEVQLEKSALSEGKWDGEHIAGEAFFVRFLDLYDKTFQDRPELKLNDEEIGQLRIPTSIYGLTKLLDEIIIKKYAGSSHLKYAILRYFNVAGADPSGLIGQDNANPTHIFANAIFQTLGKRDQLQVFGHDYETSDGTGVRDYIHVCDLADGHVQAVKYLLNPETKPDTFNLGTGKGFSVLEVIRAVEDASSKKINYILSDRRPGDVPILYANPGKANRILDWKAKYSLDEMAESAYNWHLTHPNGYKKIENR